MRRSTVMIMILIENTLLQRILFTEKAVQIIEKPLRGWGSSPIPLWELTMLPQTH